MPPGSCHRGSLKQGFGWTSFSSNLESPLFSIATQEKREFPLQLQIENLRDRNVVCWQSPCKLTLTHRSPCFQKRGSWRRAHVAETTIAAKWCFHIVGFNTSVKWNHSWVFNSRWWVMNSIFKKWNRTDLNKIEQKISKGLTISWNYCFLKLLFPLYCVCVYVLLVSTI